MKTKIEKLRRIQIGECRPKKKKGTKMWGDHIISPSYNIHKGWMGCVSFFFFFLLGW